MTRTSVLAVLGVAAVCAQAQVAVTNAPAVASATGLSVAEAAELTDGEVWNRGVEAWRESREAASSTNRLAALGRAQAILRPLMLSKSHGARASELVGAIQHELMRQAAAQDPAAASAAAADASAAMQIALRAAPDDARVQRNFTRASARVAELRDAAHVRKVLAESQGQGVDRQLGGAARETRLMMTEARSVLTNAPARMLALSEAMAARAAKLADVWIPVKEELVRAMQQNATNAQQLAYAVNEIEAAREATVRAAASLGDLEPQAQVQLAQAEAALTKFWKLTVMPPDAVAEDILCQTNAFVDLAQVNGRSWQADALDFTRAFRARFPAWAQQYEQQAQADTNKPPFTKEAQNEINALAGDVEKLQISCVKAEDPPSMLDILRKLERIRELLPRDNSGGNGANNQSQPNPQDQNKPRDDKKNDDKKNPPPEQKPDDRQQEQPPQQDEQKEPEKPRPDEKHGENPPKDDEVEALLQKAQDRNDQHEDEKKARMKHAPLSPNDRDW